MDRQVSKVDIGCRLIKQIYFLLSKKKKGRIYLLDKYYSTHKLTKFNYFCDARDSNPALKQFCRLFSPKKRDTRIGKLEF